MKWGNIGVYMGAGGVVTSNTTACLYLSPPSAPGGWGKKLQKHDFIYIKLTLHDKVVFLSIHGNVMK